MTKGKRIYRNVDDDIKLKISKTLKNRNKSPQHRKAISDGLKRYWSTIPKKPKTSDGENSGVVI